MARSYEYNDEYYRTAEDEKAGICQKIYKDKKDAEKAWFDATYKKLIENDFTGYSNYPKDLEEFIDAVDPNKKYFHETTDTWNGRHWTLKPNLEHSVVSKLICEISPYYDPYFIVEVELY